MLVYSREGCHNKTNAEFKSTEMYNFYRVKYPDMKISKQKFTAICRAYNTFIMTEMVTNGVEFYLPFRMGTLSVRKYPTRPILINNNKVLVSHLPVDWVATKAYWEKNPKAREEKKLIRLSNEHTNGYRYKFYWDKRTCLTHNQTHYSFMAARQWRVALAKVLKDENITTAFYLDETKTQIN